MPCRCQACGCLYKVDVLVPDELWDQIRPDKKRPPEAGLLCGPCIMERIERQSNHRAYKLCPAL